MNFSRLANLNFYHSRRTGARLFSILITQIRAGFRTDESEDTIRLLVPKQTQNAYVIPIGVPCLLSPIIKKGTKSLLLKGCFRAKRVRLEKKYNSKIIASWNAIYMFKISYAWDATFVYITYSWNILYTLCISYTRNPINT